MLALQIITFYIAHSCPAGVPQKYTDLPEKRGSEYPLLSLRIEMSAFAAGQRPTCPFCPAFSVDSTEEKDMYILFEQ